MNLKILILVSTGLNIFISQVQNDLPELVPMQIFQQEILDRALRRTDSSAIIMVRVEKLSENKTPSDTCDLKIRVTSLLQRDFKYFHLIKDKYFGYFEYHGHLALVYGDSFPNCFFSSTTAKKRFEFLVDSRDGTVNRPPVVVEPEVYVYRLINGKFKLIDGGRIGFYN